MLTDEVLNDLSTSVRVAFEVQRDEVKRTALISTADNVLANAESAGVLTATSRATMMQALSTLPIVASRLRQRRPSLQPERRRGQQHRVSH